jgi:D-amino-acid dehydrogenase
VRVVIVGGGVIGLACGYELLQHGAEVVIVEKGEVGAAASWGNAGWITPGLSTPLPAPGVIGSSLRWMVQPDSPLYIKPRLDPNFARWLIAFMRRCTRRAFEAGVAALADLNRHTMEILDEWQAAGIEFEMHRAGMLLVFRTEAGLRHGLEEFAVMRKHGFPPPDRVDRAELQNLAPVLAPSVIGGYLIEGDRHVQPGTLTRGLSERLTSQGAEIHPDTTIVDFCQRGRIIEAIQTSQGPITGDVFLLAAGAWSAALARRAGFRLPVQAGKGYSITIAGAKLGVEHTLYLGEAHVGVSPFNGAVRFAGTMEFSGFNETLDARRVTAIRRAAATYLNEWPRGDGEVEWVGMRPVTPDGLPALGRAPNHDNLFVATGHSMLGVTLAPATGRVMADLICSGKTDVDVRPFDPLRFTSMPRRSRGHT